MNWKVKVVKRIMDIIISSIGIVVTAPLYPIIALAIKLESEGPIFYTQIRAGALDPTAKDPLNKIKTFKMYKFRTMRKDAEKGIGAVLAKKDDPRITKVGKFLRKTRLDELPQFINVLKGDMSIVGPRPERPELLRNLALAIPFFEERMRGVKPGITGLAQISLGYSGKMLKGSELEKLKDTLLNPFKLEGVEESEADDMRTKLLYDLAYCAILENFWTFLITDLKIIFKTPLVMLLGRGQ